MTILGEAASSEMFEDLIEPVLTDDFELLASQLSNEQAAKYLTQVIQDLSVEGTKVVSIIGGPGSGKGTVVKIMIEQLKQLGWRADSIGTDDYNLNTRQWRREREREDPISLKDFSLLNKHIESIKKLADDETLVIPKYDEPTGLAIAGGEENWPHTVAKTDVLFIEGDFDAVKEPDLAVFVDVPAATRMQVRIDRDLAKRGESNPQKIADNFRSRHEKQYIPHTAPAVNKADLVLRVIPVPDNWQYDIYRARNPS